MKRLFLTAILLCLCAVQVRSENPQYSDIAKLRSMSRGIGAMRSMADGVHYTALEGNNIVKYRYDGQGQGEKLIQNLPEGLRISGYSLSPASAAILLNQGRTPIYRHSFTTNYHLANAEGVTALFTEFEGVRDASFSPSADLIAFSSLNDLYVYNIAEDKTTRITDDGEWNKIINGTTDWVYEEEIGFTKAYEFSPSSQQIAYLRFDESEVPTMEMMRFDGELYNKSYSFKYPKAGDKNSEVELWVYDIPTGKKTLIESGKGKDQYIPRFGYTPEGELWFIRLNRLQNHMEMILSKADGSTKTVYEESSPTYIERVGASTFTLLGDGKFIVKEETSKGYMHLYLYDMERGLVNPITQGEWEVTSLVGHDDKYVYYTSTEVSPLLRTLYRVRLDGKKKEALVPQDAYYTVSGSANMKYLIATSSTAQRPNLIEVLDSKGNQVRVLESNFDLANQLALIDQPTKEFFTLKTDAGDELNAYIIKPRDFSQEKKYPVMMTQYSGPGSQQVADRWSLDWVDALVEAGYVVVCVDGRGTGFRGEEFKKSTYRNLGGLEAEDQIAAAKYIANQKWADPARIGIYGWSYGGFTTLNAALKSDGLFRVAIAVAPVTTWRYYDTIYTEVYNDLPQSNPEGYDNNSPINFADQLNDKKTKLIVIHGTADDNVHFQNTVELTRALNKAGKKYDMMVYPDQNHSMYPDDMTNVRQKMIDYTIENL